MRLKGAPTPLSAVQRYVLFVFLCILLVAYFPSTTGSRGSLSVPSSSTLVQVMFGGGMPVALQLKKIKEPSQTTWSLLTLAIPGGTGKRRDTSSDSFPTLHCRRIFSLNSWVVHALTNRRLLFWSRERFKRRKFSQCCRFTCGLPSPSLRWGLPPLKF